MKLVVEQLELSTIVASLGKSRHYFEYIRKDQRIADSLQRLRLKLIKQGAKGNIYLVLIHIALVYRRRIRLLPAPTLSRLANH
jgi:hypothetical protein